MSILAHLGKSFSNPKNWHLFLQAKNQLPDFGLPKIITLITRPVVDFTTELQVPCTEEIRRSYQTSRHAGTCSFPPVCSTSENTQVGSKLLLLVWNYRYSNTGNFQVRRSARFFRTFDGFRFTAPIKITVGTMDVHPLIQWDMIGSIRSFGPFWTHPKLIEDIIPPMNHDPKNDPGKKRCLGSWVELSRGRVIRVIFAATFPLKTLVFFSGSHLAAMPKSIIFTLVVASSAHVTNMADENMMKSSKM